MNVTGVGFPGTAGVILGQNEHITWGATTNPMDVSDVFSDKLLRRRRPPVLRASARLACIECPPGTFHPVEIQFGVTYFFNSVGDSVNDNLVQASGLPPEATTIATVPFRSFGPIIDIANPGRAGAALRHRPTALVLQYTGFHATQELADLLALEPRRRISAEFQDGPRDSSTSARRTGPTPTVDGNLAYFTSAELPLRTGPRAGRRRAECRPSSCATACRARTTGCADAAHSQGQAIPFEILPAAEMPQTVNPENGFFVNANNDPAGTTLDNDPSEPVPRRQARTRSTT